MAFNVGTFKTAGLVNGGARPSLFEVELSFPLGARPVPNGGRFLIKAAQLPASTVDSIDVPYFGRKVKVVGDRTFADWTVTVMNDEDFNIREALEEWSNELNQLEGNRQTLPAGLTGASYKANMVVRQFSKVQESGVDPTATRAYTFVGAFPTSIDAISLDWDRTNTIEEFDVTFAYDYWVPTIGSLYDTGSPEIQRSSS
jgi:hypothetical protein